MVRKSELASMLLWRPAAAPGRARQQQPLATGTASTAGTATELRAGSDVNMRGGTTVQYTHRYGTRRHIMLCFRVRLSAGLGFFYKV